MAYMNSVMTNTPASMGLNNLRLNNLRLTTAMERLSSGLRINRGADDPSGLAISEGMRARLGGLSTAIQNLQDTINMIRTAGSAVEEVTQMTHRIRDLAVRGANEATLTAEDRRRIQDEIDSLKAGINQVGTNTTFNSKHITSSRSAFTTINPANITVNNNWAGPGPPAVPGDAEYDAMAAHVVDVVQDSIYKVFGMIGVAPDSFATLTINFDTIDGAGSVLATGGGGFGAMQITIDVFDFLDPDGAGPLNALVGDNPAVNVFTREMILAHEMTHAVLVSLGAAGSAWGQEMLATYVSGEGDLRINGNEGAVAAAVAGALTSAPTAIEYAEVYLAAQALNAMHGAGDIHDIVQQVIAGNDWDQAILNVVGNAYNDNFADFETAVDAYSLDYMAQGYDNAVRKTGLGWTNDPPRPGSQYLWNAQVGPNSNNTLEVSTMWLGVGAADYLAYTNVTSNQRAWDSIESVDRAEAMYSNAAAALGIQDRRMQHIIDDLQAEYINLAASRSRINDADMAVEIADFTKAQIINQSTLSVVAQANVSSQSVNDLLRMSMS